MKRAYTFIAFCLAGQLATARTLQDSTSETVPFPKYKIMITPTELLLQNLKLSAERVYDRHTLGVTVAFKPALQSSGRINTATGLFGEYRNDNAINQAYNAASLGVNSKTYFHPHVRKTTYVDAQLMYRYWWFDNKTVAYPNVEGYRFDATRSEHMNVYNARILFGGTTVWRRNKKTKTVMDFYGGLDMRYKTYEYTTTNGTVFDIPYAYLREKDSYFIAAPCIGLQLGIGR